MSDGFINRPRLLRGPWQAFERDVARLMLQNGFVDVRIVGGPGDRGADVLGVKGDELWVFQCKHTTTSRPSHDAISEVVEAGRAYGADRLAVAVSRVPGERFRQELLRYGREGLRVEVATPSDLLRLMASSPEYAPSRRPLRDYQVEAESALRDALVDTGRGQIVLATGLGKTVVMAELVADLFRDGLVQPPRALVLAHTRELVEQLHSNFWYQLPKWIQTQHLAGGEWPELWDGLVFATVQSIDANLERLPPFGLVLIDEAHHAGASMFQRCIEVLDAPMLGGVTATPWRGDGFDLTSLLGGPLYELGIADGLRRGFLSEVDYRLCADNIDWSLVQDRSNYRYSLSQLNRRLILPTRDDEAARIIRSVFEEEERRGGIVFCPTTEHARSMAATLRQHDLRAEHVSGEMPVRQRDLVMARFRAGELDFVASVDLFNEGVDVPDVDMIVFMRATHSRRIFVQQLGRGLRASPNKDKVVVLDFVTDLRRVADVVELDRTTRAGPVERLGLGDRLISFRNATAGDFLQEWVLDQASLVLREGDHTLALPRFEFPQPPPPGNVN